MLCGWICCMYFREVQKLLLGSLTLKLLEALILQRQIPSPMGVIVQNTGVSFQRLAELIKSGKQSWEIAMPK